MPCAALFQRRPLVFVLLLGAVASAEIPTSTQIFTAAASSNLSAINALIRAEPSLLNASDPVGNCVIHLAAINGHLPAARAILAADPRQLDAVGQHHMTPLHNAAWNNHARLASFLLAKGADANARANYPNDYGDPSATPMHLAAMKDHPEIIALLMTANATIDPRDAGNYTPLRLAALNNHLNATLLLLKQGADINSSANCPDDPPGTEPSITLLHSLAKAGHAAIGKALLQHGAAVDARELSVNATPLHVAVESGGKAFVQLLLEHKADIEAKSRYDGEKRDAISTKTPLISALQNRHPEIACLLIERGASLALRDRYEDSVLHLASMFGYDDVVGLLLSRNVSLLNSTGLSNFTALHYAAYYNWAQVATTLVAAGANIEAKCRHFDEDASTTSLSITPLQYAARRNSTEVGGLLIRGGANIRTQDNNGKMPIHWAASEGSIRLIHMLVDRDAGQANAKGAAGLTPLHYAAECGHPITLRTLMDRGASVNAGNTPHNTTALHYAAAKDNLDIARSLVERGANITATDDTGTMPIHTAAAEGAFQVTWYLVSMARGQLNVAGTKYGNTPLHEAARHGRTGVAQYLLEQGADVDAKRCYDGDRANTPPSVTVLVLAARHAKDTMVRLLLDHGADVNAHGRDSYTPLHWAATRKDSWSIVHLLLERHAKVDGENNRSLTPLEMVPPLEYMSNEYLDPNHRDPTFVLLATRDHNCAHRAVAKDNLAMLQRIAKEHSPALLAKGTGGKRPIEVAVELGRVEHVRLLVKAGVRTDVESGDGKSMLYLAVEGGNLETVQLVLEDLKGFSRLIDRVYRVDGTTALMLACSKGSVEMAGALFRGGAAVRLKDKGGNTALHHAVGSGSAEVVGLLWLNGGRGLVGAENRRGKTPLQLAGALRLGKIA